MFSNISPATFLLLIACIYFYWHNHVGGKQAVLRASTGRHRQHPHVHRRRDKDGDVIYDDNTLVDDEARKILQRTFLD